MKVIVHCNGKGKIAFRVTGYPSQEEKPNNLCLQRYCKAHVLADKIPPDNIAEALQEGSVNPLYTSL